MTALRYFFGEHPRFRHEFDQLREVEQVVAGTDLPGPICLVSNFLLANGEVDCLLVMPRGLVVLDLKAYVGQVFGEEEGEWRVEGPEGSVPLKTSLFRQLRTMRFDLANRLLRIRDTAFPQIDERDLRKVAAWGYFKRGSTYPPGQIDRDRVKWFDIVSAETLAERLMLIDAGYTLDEREQRAIVDALHVKPADGLVPTVDAGSTAPPVNQQPSLEEALIDRMDAIVARMEGIPRAIAGLVPPVPECSLPTGMFSPEDDVPGGCSDAIGPDESKAPLSERIRRFVRERYAAPARAEGRSTFQVTSGQVHRDMGLANRMPSVCGVLRGKKLQALCGIELIEEVRSTNVVENSTTNRFVYRIK
jgi:hypothetical protein